MGYRNACPSNGSGDRAMHACIVDRPSDMIINVHRYACVDACIDATVDLSATVYRVSLNTCRSTVPWVYSFIVA